MNKTNCIVRKFICKICRNEYINCRSLRKHESEKHGRIKSRSLTGQKYLHSSSYQCLSISSNSSCKYINYNINSQCRLPIYFDSLLRKCLFPECSKIFSFPEDELKMKLHILMHKVPSNLKNESWAICCNCGYLFIEEFHNCPYDEAKALPLFKE
jgi:hypothetical protein